MAGRHRGAEEIEAPREVPQEVLKIQSKVFKSSFSSVLVLVVVLIARIKDTGRQCCILAACFGISITNLCLGACRRNVAQASSPAPCWFTHYHDGSEELYDHENDPDEYTNLARDKQYEAIKRELAIWLPKLNAPLTPPIQSEHDILCEIDAEMSGGR